MEYIISNSSQDLLTTKTKNIVDRYIWNRADVSDSIKNDVKTLSKLPETDLADLLIRLSPTSEKSSGRINHAPLLFKKSDKYLQEPGSAISDSLFHESIIETGINFLKI